MKGAPLPQKKMKKKNTFSLALLFCMHTRDLQTREEHGE